MEPLGLIGLIGAVFTASLLGSAHCAGMCGGLVLLAVDPGSPGCRKGNPDDSGQRGEHAQGRITRPLRLQLAYHGGRGIGYTVLGVLAGAVGLSMESTARLAGVQQSAAMVAGVAMVLIGVAMAVKAFGLRLAVPAVPGRRSGAVSGGGRWRYFAASLHRRAFMLRPVTRAFAVGILTPMLPCGWLYLFAITAAGTASPVLGGVVMLSFWAGTVPILAALGAGVGLLTGSIRARLPVVGALLVIALGMLTVTGRLALPAGMSEQLARDAMQAAAFVPDGEVAGGHKHPGGASLRTAIERVNSFADQEPPCCNPASAGLDPAARTERMTEQNTDESSVPLSESSSAALAGSTVEEEPSP